MKVGFVQGYSLPLKYRKQEKWLRRLQRNYACTITYEILGIKDRVYDCNCIWKKKNVPLVAFWECKWCIHKSYAKIFLKDERKWK